MYSFISISNTVKYMFMYTFKAIAVTLEFMYAVLLLIFDFVLHLRDKISLTPFAVHWSSDSSQEADRKATSEDFERRNAPMNSEKTDVAMEDPT